MSEPARYNKLERLLRTSMKLYVYVFTMILIRLGPSTRNCGVMEEWVTAFGFREKESNSLLTVGTELKSGKNSRARSSPLHRSGSLE